MSILTRTNCNIHTLCYTSIYIIKGQGRQPIVPLYPIPSSEMDTAFNMLSYLDDDDLTFLRDDYLHHLANTDPTHFLMTFEAR